jgi:putative Mg2+ transporter-C (MgtC) family protein
LSAAPDNGHPACISRGRSDIALTSTSDDILSALAHEFGDVHDLAEAAVLLARMLVAMLLSGLIGLERERSEAPAGFRTHMLVGLGSALFVMVPLQAGVSPADLTRVVQGVVSGIGFLGAGAILKESRGTQVRGLTTAASIFATAAIGVTAGMGKVMTAILATVLVLVILALLHKLERRMGWDNNPDRPLSS